MPQEGQSKEADPQEPSIPKENLPEASEERLATPSESPVDTMDGGASELMPEDSPTESAPSIPESDERPNESRPPDSSTRPPLGRPIQTQDNKWVWVDIPTSRCGYGKPTGFAINAHPGATQLYIYLQGGGGCWKSSGVLGNCFALQPSAVNLKGYNKKTFEKDLITRQNIRSFFFRRDTPANVFSKAHHVFLPYCTGDVFSGSTMVDYGKGKRMYYYGHINMKAFLARIVPTFPKVKHVVIAGSSAGGFGAALNWGLTQQYFGRKVRVDLLNDSGPPMPPAGNRWQEWSKTWKMALPPGCSKCDQGIGAILEHYRKTLLTQGRKMAFLSYERDNVIRAFFGLNDLTGTRFKKALYNMLDQFKTLPNTSAYILPGLLHTMLVIGPENIRTRKKVALTQWIEWMVKDDPSWKNQIP